MEAVASDLQAVLNIADRLRQIDEATASVKPAPGKWSKKEIIGHLIDSAANNHQRFVRLQYTDHIDLPGYAQDDWVRLNHYQDRRWQDLVDLWQMYNTHLATVIRHVDSKALKNVWKTPSGEELTLEFIVRDYVVHMRHHLDQISGK